LSCPAIGADRGGIVKTVFSPVAAGCGWFAFPVYLPRACAILKNRPMRHGSGRAFDGPEYTGEGGCLSRMDQAFPLWAIHPEIGGDR